MGGWPVDSSSSDGNPNNTAPATTTTTAPSGPSPTQDGIVADCKFSLNPILCNRAWFGAEVVSPEAVRVPKA
jgi:hypothetical protein